MTIQLCVPLWATAGCEAALVDYEDTVLALIPQHGGQVVSRVRRLDRTEGPFEVQLITFPDDDSVSAYMVVSWVVSDVLTRQRQRDHEQARRKSQS